MLPMISGMFTKDKVAPAKDAVTTTTSKKIDKTTEAPEAPENSLAPCTSAAGAKNMEATLKSGKFIVDNNKELTVKGGTKQERNQAENQSKFFTTEMLKNMESIADNQTELVKIAKDSAKKVQKDDINQKKKDDLITSTVKSDKPLKVKEKMSILDMILGLGIAAITTLIAWWSAASDHPGGMIGWLWDVIKKGAINIWKALDGWAQSQGGWKQVFIDAGMGILKGLAAIGDAVLNFGSWIITKGAELWAGVSTYVTENGGWWEVITSGVGNAFKWVYENITSPVLTAIFGDNWRAIENTFREMMNEIAKYGISGWLKNQIIASMPKLASLAGLEKAVTLEEEAIIEKAEKIAEETSDGPSRTFKEQGRYKALINMGVVVDENGDDGFNEKLMVKLLEEGKITTTDLRIMMKSQMSGHSGTEQNKPAKIAKIMLDYQVKKQKEEKEKAKIIKETFNYSTVNTEEHKDVRAGEGTAGSDGLNGTGNTTNSKVVTSNMNNTANNKVVNNNSSVKKVNTNIKKTQGNKVTNTTLNNSNTTNNSSQSSTNIAGDNSTSTSVAVNVTESSSTTVGGKNINIKSGKKNSESSSNKAIITEQDRINNEFNAQISKLSADNNEHTLLQTKANVDFDSELDF